MTLRLFLSRFLWAAEVIAGTDYGRLMISLVQCTIRLAFARLCNKEDKVNELRRSLLFEASGNSSQKCHATLWETTHATLSDSR